MPARQTLSTVTPIVAVLVGAIVMWVMNPQVRDLQAAIAREDATRSGVGLSYWLSWFGGVSPGSYSVLVPYFSAAIGSLTVLCVATVLVVILAHPIANRAQHPTLLRVAVAVAALANMASGRVTFAAGAVFAVAAVSVIAIGSGRQVWHVSVARAGSGALLVVAGLCSPLAPAFAGMFALPLLFQREWQPHRPAVVATLAGSALGLLAPFVMFGNPGSQVFPVTSLVWALGIAAAIAVLLHDTTVKFTVPLFAVVAVALFIVPNGVGSNLVRYSYLVLPAIACYFALKSPKVVVLLLVPALVYAAFNAGDDLADAAATKASGSLYSPVLEQLRQLPNIDNHRVELVDAVTHAGSHEIGSQFPLARGWENQSDARFNDPIFRTEGALTPQSYHQWLLENAVSYLVVSEHPLSDQKPEAHLVAAGLPYLQQLWGNSDWRLYEVRDPRPIVPPPLQVVEQSPKDLVVYFPDGRRYQLQLRPNRYLVVHGQRNPDVFGCVRGTADEWVTISVPTPGQYVIEGAFSWRGVLGWEQPECTGS